MCCPRTAAGEGFDAGTGGDANGKGAVARVVKVMPDGDSDCGPQRTGLLAVPTRYCALTPDTPGQFPNDAKATGAWTAGANGAKAVAGAPGPTGPAFIATDATNVGTAAHATGVPVAASMKVRPVDAISAQISARVTRRGPVATPNCDVDAATSAGPGPQSIG